MNIYKTSIFKHIDGGAIGDKEITLTMGQVVPENLPQHNGKTEEKLVLYFKETEKGLILNKTNVKAICGCHGGETDDWIGKRIVLFTISVKAFGEVHPHAIRVRCVNESQPAEDEFDFELPEWDEIDEPVAA